MRIRVGNELMGGGPRVLAAAPGVRIPVLLVHGAGDELCRAVGSRTLLPRLGSTDKALIEYPGCLHETFNEPPPGGRDTATADVVAWLLRHAD
jgi:alpha-beta hydrolase superfamily lysophospholipase